MKNLPSADKGLSPCAIQSIFVRAGTNQLVHWFFGGKGLGIHKKQVYGLVRPTLFVSGLVLGKWRVGVTMRLRMHTSILTFLATQSSQNKNLFHVLYPTHK